MRFSSKKLRIVRETYLFSKAGFWEGLWAHLGRGGLLVEFSMRKDVRYRPLLDRIEGDENLKQRYQQALEIGRVNRNLKYREQWDRFKKMGILKQVA